MAPDLADLMRAMDDLELLYRKVFDTFEPLWDEDERTMRRALAVLHAWIKEINQ